MDTTNIDRIEQEERLQRIEYLKNAVWETWLRGVRSGMGAGTPTEMLKEYGFTGDFAGLDEYFKHPLEIAYALESVSDNGEIEN